MGQIINFSRAFDGVVYAAFLLFFSGFALFGAGELYKTVNSDKKKHATIATVINKIFPFPDQKYEHNLTHILLFGLLVAMLSMMHHYAQDTIKEKHEKQEKKEKKRKEREKQKEAEAERKKNPEKKAEEKPNDSSSDSE